MSTRKKSFDDGDMLQASEKTWGAVAHYVKSIARELGWPNKSHKDIIDNALSMMEYMPNKKQYREMFWKMRTMHINFYEENLPSNDVLWGIDDAKTLIDAFKRAEPKFPRKRPSLKKVYGESRNQEKRRSSTDKRRKEFS